MQIRGGALARRRRRRCRRIFIRSRRRTVAFALRRFSGSACITICILIIIKVLKELDVTSCENKEDINELAGYQ